MMMPVEPGLVDANVLAYALNADAPQHEASRALLDAAKDPSVRLYVTSQILCELYSLITNPRRVTVVSTSGYTFNTDDFDVFPELEVVTP
jgi:predicted nucleic acid-binding protein